MGYGNLSCSVKVASDRLQRFKPIANETADVCNGSDAAGRDRQLSTRSGRALLAFFVGKIQLHPISSWVAEKYLAFTS
jgi:hypothetical protein